MKKYQLYFVQLIVVFSFLSCYVNAQVPTYRGIKRIGHDIFNLQSTAKHVYNYSSSNELHVVYSDRSSNKAYNTEFGQRVLQEVAIGDAFYIIGEKNGCFQVVKADPKSLGRPKGIFGFLFSSDNHFKDGENTLMTGWIPKSNLLLYDHSFVSARNHMPIKYRVGFSTLSRLYETHPYIEGDSILVFKEPFLKTKANARIAMGEIVYAYKYDDTKHVVLISDKPKLSDPNRKVLGWIPSDMILESGQLRVYKTDMNTKLDTIVTLSKDTLNIMPMDLQSPILFVGSDALLNDVLMQDSSRIGHKIIELPISVWDRTKNKLINVKGGDIMISDISKMIAGQKNINFHLFIFSKEKNDIKRLVSSFQNLSLKFQPGNKQNFSATIISERGNIYFNPTENFSKWLDFLSTPPDRVGDKNDAGFSNAISHLVHRLSPDCFENNILMVLGGSESISIPNRLHSELARRSFSIVFLQLFGDVGEGGQDYLLKSKDIIDDNITAYNDYISNYVVDANLLKPSLFSDYGNGDKIYLLDAPTSSLATGGIVFPASNEKLSTSTVGMVLDTLMSQIKDRDALLSNSLVKYEKRLGVVRSRPSRILFDLYKNANDTIHNINDIDRNSIADTYLLHASIADSVLSKLPEGYLLTEEDTKNLLQNFRDLLPVFADSIGKKELSVIRKVFYIQKDLVNKQNACKMLNRKSTLSDYFYRKTGIEVNDSILYELRVPQLRRKIFQTIDWNVHYRSYIDKIDRLEELFMKDRLEKISISGTYYYFIPKNDLP